MNAAIANAVVSAHGLRKAYKNKLALDDTSFQIEAGKIKALAITSKTASPKFPGVKPLAEQGFPGFEAEPWYGMIGSKGLPKDLAERMNKYVQDILAQDHVKQKISELGADAFGMSTGEFAKLISADIKKWGAAVKASGATAD